MREQPNERIATDAVKAWQLTAHLFAIIPLLITIAAFVIAYFF